MAQDTTDDAIKVLSPDLVHQLGHEFFKLLVRLDTHDKAVIAAYKSGDVDAARRKIEDAI